MCKKPKPLKNLNALPICSFPHRKYTVIGSPEQRQRYKNDFNAEYSEYRGLHARIEGITRQFTVLDNELKQLQQGTDKYKVESLTDAHKSAVCVFLCVYCSLNPFYLCFILFFVFYLQTIHNQILQEYHKIKKVSWSPSAADFDGTKYLNTFPDCDYMLFHVAD